MPLGSGFHEKHLYHATLPARVVYTAEDELKAKIAGYQEEYIPQEYPKQLANGKVARNAEEEAALSDLPADETPAEQGGAEVGVV